MTALSANDETHASDFVTELDPVSWDNGLPRACEMKRFAGQYIVLKDTRSDNNAPVYSSDPGEPRFHETIEDAEADVGALLEHFPHDVFLIVRQVARGRTRVSPVLDGYLGVIPATVESAR